MLPVSVAKHLLRTYNRSKNYFDKNYDKTIYMHNNLSLSMIASRHYYSITLSLIKT